MKIRQLHRWDVTPAQAVRIQNELRPQISTRSAIGDVRIVAGVDISIKHNTAKAAVPVLRWAGMEVVDLSIVEQPVPFPYVPGLLSFRESPSILAALGQLSIEPDLIIVDGQGIAHPRRFGIAAHLGLLVDTPTIGCAKTRLCGTHDEPDIEAGSFTYLYDRDEVIGAVVRTKTNVNPVFVSIGHKIDLQAAIRYVLDCCRGYRLPEPTRLAHQAAGGNLTWDRSRSLPKRVPLFG